MTFDEIKWELSEIKSNWTYRNNSLIKKELNEIKYNALENNKQNLVREIWIFNQVLIIQDEYIKAFKKFKKGKLYDAWCGFERVEGATKVLERHFKIDSSNAYEISFIKKHVRQHQSLYPYKLFISPEITNIKKICSICKKRISLRNHCGHRPGEIYDGEICGRIITRCDLAAISLVENPVQKYSVVFMSDNKNGKQRDQYDYFLQKFLAKALSGPFDGWSVEKTTRRHSHENYKNLPGNALCPCGSEEKYKNCCFLMEGVLYPHFQFLFLVPPSKKLSNFIKEKT